jgi:hypothetical protein
MIAKHASNVYAKKNGSWRLSAVVFYVSVVLIKFFDNFAKYNY